MTSLAYFERIREVLAWVEREQGEAIAAAAELIAPSLIEGGIWHLFGTGHSHLAAEELYYRAGGLACVNAILYPPLMQHEGPFTSTKLERMPGMARVVYERYDLRPGEVLTIVSNSGKNAVPVEMAQLAREDGLKTIALTSRAQSEAAETPAGVPCKLYETCDLVIDNGGVPGDAALSLPNTEAATGPTSSVINLAILQQIVYSVCERFAEAGQEPPLFKTANLPGGDVWNRALIERYGNRVNLK